MRNAEQAERRSGAAGCAALTCGVDVGSSTVKAAVFRVENEIPHCLALYAERIRRRDPRGVVSAAIETALSVARVSRGDLDYLASTGEGDLVEDRSGHFYGMTTHARGAVHLVPGATAVLDVGALHTRAIRIDERSKVLGYKMTSRCASGTGQFLENIARYLGVALDEVGEVSARATAAEAPSSICAVLAETDCINMVSRGIATADILQGIHLSMAGRFLKLLAGIGAAGTVVATGGLSANRGLVDTLSAQAKEGGHPFTFVTHPDAIHAGAIGAALWGAFRWRKLSAKDEPHKISGGSTR